MNRSQLRIFLRLDDLNLTSLPPLSSVVYKDVETLHLMNNRFKTLPFGDLFGHKFPKCRSLFISNNQIEKQIECHFPRNMGVIGLSNNKITWFKSYNVLDKLDTLILTNNLIGTEAATDIIRNNDLSYLSFSYNKIKTFVLSENNLDRLKVLGLSDNPLEHFEIEKNNSLERLDLRDTEIKDLSSLVNAPALKTLFLNDTLVEELPFMPNLKLVSLSPIQRELEQQIRAVNSHVEINFDFEKEYAFF